MFEVGVECPGNRCSHAKKPAYMHYNHNLSHVREGQRMYRHSNPSLKNTTHNNETLQVKYTVVLMQVLPIMFTG
jgi:hypothetical protein